MSVKELIDCARACAEEDGGGCKVCNFCNTGLGVGDLILALADKLEEMISENGIDRGIEWIPFEAAKPTEADEYLVIIAGAKKSTSLWYDPEEEIFYENDAELEVTYYPITHWAEMPSAPEGTEEGKEVK